MIFGGIFTTMKESVKINSKIVDRIRKHIKRTGQTISGYIDLTLDKDLNEKENYVSVSEYAVGMTQMLSEVIKTTKKKK